jgi:hypothetical protein
MTPTKPKFELKLGMATREAFGKALVVAGRENKDIVVGDADLSKPRMRRYSITISDRFLLRNRRSQHGSHRRRLRVRRQDPGRGQLFLLRDE